MASAIEDHLTAERQRFVLTQKGDLMVISESGLSRDFTPDKLSQLKTDIEKQLSIQTENLALQELYKKFPQKEEPKTKA